MAGKRKSKSVAEERKLFLEYGIDDDDGIVELGEDIQEFITKVQKLRQKGFDFRPHKTSKIKIQVHLERIP